MVIKGILQLAGSQEGVAVEWLAGEVLKLMNHFAVLLRVKRRDSSVVCPRRQMGGSVFIHGTGAKL
jgi:hypothetical protein